MSRPLVMTVEEPQEGHKWTYVFKRSPIILGRDDEACDVVLSRVSVSKVQSEVIFDDNKVAYRDLDSRNGSIVDGEPIPADVNVALSEKSNVIVGGRLRLSFSRDGSIRPSEGICPFAPRIKRPMILDPTAVHVGPLPNSAPAQPPSPAPRPAVAIPLYPMPDPGEEPLATERMAVPPVSPPKHEPEPAEAEKMAGPVAPADDDQPGWSARPASGSLNPGDIIKDHYRVERLIGRGGMGAVYEVSHLHIPAKRFAMKILSAEALEHPEAETRFMREAKAASLINHPHVVSVIDFGRDRGVSYLVMELLVGEELAAVIRRRRLPVEKVADIMLAVCAGVNAAHQLSIIHRDLKPANIFLSRNEMDQTVPKVLDFGISKVGLPGESNLTQRFSLIGTPNYLSPEAAQGLECDARSDVYALGTILYECLTGRWCHQGDSVYEILRSIVEGAYPVPTKLCPDLPPRIETIILKALERDRQKRFRSAFELGRELVPFASPKRQSLWNDVFGDKSDSTWDSGQFTGGAVSLTKGAVKPVQAPTAILPADEAKKIQDRPFPVEELKRPASASPRSVRQPPVSSRPPSHEEARPPLLRRSKRRILPLVAGSLLFLVVGVAFILRGARSPGAVVVTPETTTPAASATEVNTPLLAAPPALPRPSAPPQAESATKTATIVPPEKRPTPPTQPPRRPSKEPPARHINHNRNGIPILKL